MDTTLIVSIISSLGIGGVVGALIKQYFSRWEKRSLQEKEKSLERYRNLLPYMSLAIEPERTDVIFVNAPRDFSSMEKDDVKQYALTHVKAHYHQALLFASDDVIKSLIEFIREPSKEKYTIVAFQMRKDIWGKASPLADKIREMSI